MAQQECEQPPSAVHPVFRLLPDAGPGPVDDARRDLLLAMRGEAVQEDRAGCSVAHQRVVDDEAGEGTAASGGLVLLAH